MGEGVGVALYYHVCAVISASALKPFTVSLIVRGRRYQTVSISHSFCRERKATAGNRTDARRVDQPKDADTRAVSGVWLRKAARRPSEPDRNRIVRQHSGTAETAQHVDFNLSVPNTACHFPNG